MSDALDLTSKFVVNPLAPEPEGGGTPVARLMASPHKDQGGRYSLAIQFGTVHNGAIVKDLSIIHSHHMMAEIVNLSPDSITALNQREIKEVFESFETGSWDKIPKLVA